MKKTILFLLGYIALLLCITVLQTENKQLKLQLSRQDEIVLQWRAEAANWRQGAVYFSDMVIAMMNLAGGENDDALPEEITGYLLAKGGWKFQKEEETAK